MGKWSGGWDWIGCVGAALLAVGLLGLACGGVAYGCSYAVNRGAAAGRR